jgi:hypothetical protein
VAFVAVVAGALSACNTAGVSYVYMAIDSGGLQHRQLFYTDSNSIYCIADFSSARPDATLDFVIHQTGVYSWCNAGSLDTNPAHVHSTFAVGEVVPGKGVETVVAELLEPNGINVDVMCNGYCTQNLSNDDLCAPGITPSLSGTCRPTYLSEGADSCGPGLTCCEQTVVNASSGSMSGTPFANVPYPAGQYTCVVSLDGVEVGETSFDVVYPNPSCPVPPPITNVPCYNWFPEASQCPGFEPSTTCTCTNRGIWDCH